MSRSYKAPSDIRHLLIGSPKRAEFVQRKNKGIQRYWEEVEPVQEPEKLKGPSKYKKPSPRLKPEDYKRTSPTFTQAIETAKQKKKRNLDELTTTEKKDILPSGGKNDDHGEQQISK